MGQSTWGLSLIVVFSGATNVSVGVSNFITYWTEDTNTGAIQGSSCLHDPYRLQPKLPLVQSCAVSQDLFQNGQACGKCFVLRYDGSPSVYGGPERGRPGSAKIQVINSGAGDTQHFDCLSGVYKQITGAAPDGYPISFSEVDCAGEGLDAYHVQV